MNKIDNFAKKYGFTILMVILIFTAGYATREFTIDQQSECREYIEKQPKHKGWKWCWKQLIK